MLINQKTMWVAIFITPGEMMWLWTKGEAEGKKKMAPLKTVEFLPMFAGAFPC